MKFRKEVVERLRKFLANFTLILGKSVENLQNFKINLALRGSNIHTLNIHLMQNI